MRKMPNLFKTLIINIVFVLTACASSNGSISNNSSTVTDNKNPPNEPHQNDDVAQFKFGGFASKINDAEIIALGILDNIHFFSSIDDRTLTFNFAIIEKINDHRNTQVAVRARSNIVENMPWVTNDRQSIIETGLIAEERLVGRLFLLLLDREMYVENTRLNGFTPLPDHYDLGAAIYVIKDGKIHSPQGLIAPLTLSEARNYISKIRKGNGV